MNLKLADFLNKINGLKVKSHVLKSVEGEVKMFPYMAFAVVGYEA